MQFNAIRGNVFKSQTSSLKITVSVVRFRPWAPPKYFSDFMKMKHNVHPAPSRN